MCKRNFQIITSQCGLSEDKSMPNMADVLKFDQIYPNSKYILGSRLSKDHKSVTGGGQKVRLTSRALTYMLPQACFGILTAEGMNALRISFDPQYVWDMGRLAHHPRSPTVFVDTVRGHHSRTMSTPPRTHCPSR